MGAGFSIPTVSEDSCETSPQPAEMSYMTSLSYVVVTKLGSVKTPPFLTVTHHNTGLLFCLTPILGLSGTLLPEIVFTNRSLQIPDANRSCEISGSWNYCGESLEGAPVRSHAWWQPCSSQSSKPRLGITNKVSFPPLHSVMLSKLC